LFFFFLLWPGLWVGGVRSGTVGTGQDPAARVCASDSAAWHGMA